jgi:hemoglobin/transferrin/lactoferrin receptor protein
LDNGTHSPLRHAAPFFGKVALAYTQNRLQMELYTLFQGKRYHADMPEEEKTKTEIYALDADGKVYAPAWTTLNLKAQYKAGTNLWLNVGVENLTDLRYRYYSSGISAPGRNF